MLSAVCALFSLLQSFWRLFNGKNWSFISWVTSEKAQVAVCSQPALCLLLSRSCFSRKRAGCCWQTNWCCVNILFLLKATHRGRVGASSLGARWQRGHCHPALGEEGEKLRASLLIDFLFPSPTSCQIWMFASVFFAMCRDGGLVAQSWQEAADILPEWRTWRWSMLWGRGGIHAGDCRRAVTTEGAEHWGHECFPRWNFPRHYSL